MFFDGYQLHKEAQIRNSLLWEYEIKDFDWQAMRDIVVQRVIERGKMEDFYASLNLYGLDNFIRAVKNIPYLNKKDISFVCKVFEIKKKELKCYTREQLRHQHWNSLKRINNSLTIDEIRLAGFDDMAAMKLNAIVGNGTRIKDFIDIAFLSNKMTLNQVLSAYEMKYTNNPLILLKALTYFDEINFKEPIKMLENQSYNWKQIEKQLAKMIKFPDKVF